MQSIINVQVHYYYLQVSMHQLLITHSESLYFPLVHTIKGVIL